VLTQAAWVVAIGATGGLIGAVIASQLIKAQLFGIDALDARVYALALAGLAVIVIVASAWPARTATRVDPASVLRDS
jgi:ABC-type antimicrobial peptide transport system permease subunit